MSKADIAWVSKIQQKARKTLAQKERVAQAKANEAANKAAETPAPVEQPAPETKTTEQANDNSNPGKQ